MSKLNFLLPWIFVIFLGLLCINFAEAKKNHYAAVVEKFETFLRDHNYNDGHVAVMHNGRLLFNHMTGIKSNPTFPASSWSKLFTGIAILQLVDRDELKLSDKVFGEKGVLNNIEPLKPLKWSQVDKRLLDINVEHLLRHTAGWDQNKPPMYDPLFNQVYSHRGHHVINIQKTLNHTGKLSVNGVIKYVLTQKLHHNPGTRYSENNFGYILLGKIIEKVSRLSYRRFARKNILQPCGMWNTFIQTFEGSTTSSSEDKLPEIWTQLDYEYLDSALGWITTAPDMLRFLASLTGQSDVKLLSPQYLKTLFTHDKLGRDNEESWHGIDLRVNRNGTLWAESDQHFPDALFIHKGLPAKYFQVHTDKILRVKNTVHHTSDHGSYTLISFMDQDRHMKLRPHFSQFLDMFVSVHSQQRGQGHDLFPLVLSQFTFPSGYHLHSAVPEHQLVAYLMALKHSRLLPYWINSYLHNNEVYFIVLSKQINKHVNMKVFVSPSTRHIHESNKRWTRHGYSASLVHSYTDGDNKLKTLVLFVKHEAHFSKTGHLPKMNKIHYDDSYKYRRHYIMNEIKNDVIQPHSPQIIKTEIAQKCKKCAPYKTVKSLTLGELKEAINHNAIQSYILRYLDYQQENSSLSFSAHFSKAAGHGKDKWLFLDSIAPADLLGECHKWGTTGYRPDMIVAYQTAAGQLELCILWKKV